MPILEHQLLLKQLATQVNISDKMLRLSLDAAPHLMSHTFTMMLKGLTKDYDRVSWPADWWQAFKQRWFPWWLKRQFPIRIEERVCGRFCPHITVGADLTHLKWLEYGD